MATLKVTRQSTSKPAVNPIGMPRGEVFTPTGVPNLTFMVIDVDGTKRFLDLETGVVQAHNTGLCGVPVESATLHVKP